MMNIWKKIKTLIKQGCDVYLLTVIESKGSAPGRKGFKMIVANNGHLFGSIGGGVMEYKMVEKARALLKEGLVEQQLIKQVHQGDSKASSGMICSGSQLIAFNYLCSDDLSLLQSMHQSTKAIEFSNNGIALVASNQEMASQVASQHRWSYRELPNKNPVVHLFGAGHVSVPTAKLLTEVGFDVFLYDNRSEINTFANNKFVCDKRLIDYAKVLTEVRIGSHDYVVLMTHKFTEDKLLLSQLLRQNYLYLGVLGSENKIKVMFEALKQAGFSLRDLAQVHAPIGLKINSQTTTEIAVSIVAEIIRVKNC